MRKSTNPTASCSPDCTFLIAAKIGPNQLKLIGDVNFFLQNSDQDEQGIQAEVNIMIGDPSARGKGFAKEALLVGLRYAIEQLHVKQFLAKISDINTSSIALFQKSLQWPITAHSDVFSETTFQLNVSTDIASQLVSSTTDYQILKYEDIHMQVIQPQ